MPDSPKRKKLEKNTPQKLTQSNRKFICCRCGTAYSRQKGYFPVSHSPMYRGTGYLPICCDCIDSLYEQYREMLADDRETMRRICMKLDLYWNDAIYDMVERTAGVHSRVRNYIGKTNLIKYIDKTFDDTLLEESIKNIEKNSDTFEFGDHMLPIDEENNEDDLSSIEQSTIDFWGRGYDAMFYDDLEKRYSKWTKGLGELTPVQESLYKQVCLNEVIIARSSAKGEAADKATKNLLDALGSLNIKPSQTKNDAQDAELEKMPLGVGIQTWEFSRPLPETPDELKDKSHIIKDITIWFLGHACKMVGLRNSYCRMYEQAMDELRVKRPEYADEDDDTMLADIFGDCKPAGGDER